MKPKAMTFRTPYNYDIKATSDETGLKCADESRTKQSFKEEVDINTIVKRFGLTGKLPDNVRVPQYGDFSQVTDFHTAMNVVAAAGEAFDKLPAEIRAKFANNPGNLVDFVSDAANYDEALKLGLVMPRPKPTDATAAPSGGASAPFEGKPHPQNGPTDKKPPKPDAPDKGGKD